MPNVEFIARNGIVSRGNLVVSGSVISTSPASFSGSLSVTGSIVSTNNIQGNQFSSTVGSVIGGRYFSDVLIAAGTVTYGSYSTTNVANFDIYANNENVGNGALLRLSSRFGGDNGAYLVSSLTGSVVLAVNGTGNSGLVLNGSTMNVGIGVSTPTGRLQVRGSGTTSSTTALLVQNSNASSSLVVNDAGYVGIGASPSATSPVYLYQNTGSSISDLEIFHEYPSSLSQRAYTNLTLTSKQVNGNHGSQYINFKHVGGNAPTFVGGTLAFDLYDSGTGYSTFQLQTKVPGQSLATRFAIDHNGNTLLGRQYGNESIIITEPTFTATSPLPAKTIGIVTNNQASGWGGFGLIIKAGPANNNLSTNLKGGELYLRAGESLGTGGSDILLQIPTPSGSAGTVLNSTYQTAMLISGSGNIGIGTLLPAAKVHISGSSNSVLLEIDSPAVNNIIFVSGSGNVGIRTSTPAFTLDVSGSGNFTNSAVITGSLTVRGPAGGVGGIYILGEPYTGVGQPFTGSYQTQFSFSTGYNPAPGAYTYPSFQVLGGGGATGNYGSSFISISHGASGVNMLSLTGGGRNFSFYPYEQYIYSSANLNLMPAGSTGIGTTSPSARLTVKGTGATSATTAFRVENTNLSGSLTVLDNGFVGIGKNTPISTLHLGNDTGGFLGDFTTPTITFNTLNNGIYLDSNRINFKAGGGFAFGCDSNGVIGNGFRINAGLFNDLTTPIFVPVRTSPLGENSAGYGGNTAGNLSLITSGSSRLFISSSGNVGIGTITPSASLHVVGNTILSGSAGSGSALYAYKSGSTVLDIQGSQGQLFSVIDALSGSLMSVNDISGLPIVEVFSDDRVVMGTYGAPAVIISGSNTVISGSLRGRVVTLSTASATASMDCSLSNFFDLTLSGSMYLTPTNILPGETINLRITQPATSGSLNYTSSIKFPNGLPYTASATSSVVDLVSFISFDSSTLYATAIKNLV